ncbi:MAG: DUF3189 family protein [Alicyclobacillaceae bacterium]|nr:DUF3189 family protein [Alicyclobacillaceae bacterium]
MVYYCYGSAHSSVVCAAIHLGRLPEETVTAADIAALVDYDTTESWSIGTLFFKGIDSFGHPVYTLGLGPERQRALAALTTFLDIPGVGGSTFVFAEALPHIGWLARFGGALSRRYGLVRWGRPLSAWAIARHYPDLCRFVRRVQRTESRLTEAVIDAPRPVLS